jgi:hypothetical protein
VSCKTFEKHVEIRASFLETKSFESFCFLNQNTFLLEDSKSKYFEALFFENKELLSLLFFKQ